MCLYELKFKSSIIQNITVMWILNEMSLLAKILMILVIYSGSEG